MVLDEPKDLVGQGSGPLGSRRAVSGQTAKTALHSNNILPETEYDDSSFLRAKANMGASRWSASRGEKERA
jgi:hypothetical protein